MAADSAAKVDVGSSKLSAHSGSDAYRPVTMDGRTASIGERFKMVVYVLCKTLFLRGLRVTYSRLCAISISWCLTEGFVPDGIYLLNNCSV